MPVSARFYLADAVFVAAVEGDQGLLDALWAALRSPVYLPFLGRRSCPPAQPIELNIYRCEDLWGALTVEPWQASAWLQRRRAGEHHIDLEVVSDVLANGGFGESVRDEPIRFDPRHRRYGMRDLNSSRVTVVHPFTAKHRKFTNPPHDPMRVLGGK